MQLLLLLRLLGLLLLRVLLVQLPLLIRRRRWSVCCGVLRHDRSIGRRLAVTIRATAAVAAAGGAAAVAPVQGGAGGECAAGGSCQAQVVPAAALGC